MRVAKRLGTGALVLLLPLPFFAQPVEVAAVAVKAEARTSTPESNRAPGSRLRFVEAFKGGTAPKFLVIDENGVKWIVKLGPEAKPETAAARLIRAAGYIADEDYYRSKIHVAGLQPMPNGKKYFGANGLVREARLERAGDGKPVAWSWSNARPADKRAFNGLRVMMALINNWDLKTSNNSVRDAADGRLNLYVSDLGASFGRTGNACVRSKGVMEDYVNSKFVKRVTAEHVDFVIHDRPLFLSAVWPKYYLERVRMERVAEHIPKGDARAVGIRLGRLSPRQITGIFRDAGFSPTEADGYTRTVLQRIDTLKKL